MFNKIGNIGRNLISSSVSENPFCCREAINITYSEYVSVALITQNAKRMHRIILSSAACVVLTYLFTLSHKRHDLRGKKLLHIKYVLFFSTTLSEIFLIKRIIQRDIIINIQGGARNVIPLIVHVTLFIITKAFDF